MVRNWIEPGRCWNNVSWPERRRECELEKVEWNSVEMWLVCLVDAKSANVKSAGGHRGDSEFSLLEPNGTNCSGNGPLSKSKYFSIGSSSTGTSASPAFTEYKIIKSYISNLLISIYANLGQSQLLILSKETEVPFRRESDSARSSH